MNAQTPQAKPLETADLRPAMERYASGNDLAFSTIYSAMAPRLYAFLLKRTRNAAQAEDLVQQTFLQVHASRSRYATGSEVAPWFFAIARHLLIDASRRARPSVSLSDAPNDVQMPSALVSDRGADEALYSKQLESLLEEQLLQVSPKHRAAFRLVKLDGLSHAEVANALGTTATAVKVRIHRVCRMLQEASPARARSSVRSSAQQECLGPAA